VLERICKECESSTGDRRVISFWNSRITRLRGRFGEYPLKNSWSLGGMAVYQHPFLEKTEGCLESSL